MSRDATPGRVHALGIAFLDLGTWYGFWFWHHCLRDVWGWRPCKKTYSSYVLHALFVRTKLKVSFLETGLRSPLVFQIAITVYVQMLCELPTSWTSWINTPSTWDLTVAQVLWVVVLHPSLAVVERSLAWTVNMGESWWNTLPSSLSPWNMRSIAWRVDTVVA